MFISLVAATAAALAPAPLAKLAIDQGIQRHDVGALDLIVVLFLVSAIVYAVATYAQTYLVGWVGQRALQDLRIRLFIHLQRLSIGFYSRNRTGVIISRMTNDVEALDQLVEDGMATLIQSGLTLIGVVVILFVLDSHLALLTFLALPVLAVGAFLFRIASADAYRLTREKIASITGYLQETLSGIRVVRAFGQERAHIKRFAELNDENRAANMTTVKLNAAYFPAVEFLSALVTVEILVIGGFEAINGHTSTGVVFAFIAALNNFFDPIQQAVAAVHDLPVRDGRARQDLRPARRAARSRRRARRDARCRSIRGEIRFDDVSFRYGASDGDAGAWALRDLDLVIPPGPDGRAGRRDRRRQVDVREAGGALLRPHHGRRARRRPRPAHGHRAIRSARRWGSSPRRASCSAARSARTSRSADLTRPTRRSRRRPARSARTSSSPSSRTATTRRSASVACSCRPASASWSRSRERSSPIRAYLSSTRQPRTSTCTPRA